MWKIFHCVAQSPPFEVLYNTFLLEKSYLFHLKFQYFYLSDKKEFFSLGWQLQDRIDAITTSFIWDIIDIPNQWQHFVSLSLKKASESFLTRAGLRSLVTLSSKQSLCPLFIPPYNAELKLQFFTVRQV